MFFLTPINATFSNQTCARTVYTFFSLFVYTNMTIFEVKRRRTTKMSKTFSARNGVPNTVHKFFPQKIPYWLDEGQKTGFGGIFSPILVVLLGRLFPKTKGFTHRWTRIKHVNFMKSSKLRLVLYVFVHK